MQSGMSSGTRLCCSVHCGLLQLPWTAKEPQGVTASAGCANGQVALPRGQMPVLQHWQPCSGLPANAMQWMSSASRIAVRMVTTACHYTPSHRTIQHADSAQRAQKLHCQALCCQVCATAACAQRFAQALSSYACAAMTLCASSLVALRCCHAVIMAVPIEAETWCAQQHAGSCCPVA